MNAPGGQRGMTMIDALFGLMIGAMVTAGGILLWQGSDPSARSNISVVDAVRAANEHHLGRYRPVVSQTTVCESVREVAGRGWTPLGRCEVTPGVPGFLVEGALTSCAHVVELTSDGVHADLLGDGQWNLEYQEGRQGGVLRHLPTNRAYDWVAPQIGIPHSVQLAEWQAAHSRSGEITTASRSGEGAQVAGTLLTCAQVQAAINAATP